MTMNLELWIKILFIAIIIGWTWNIVDIIRERRKWRKIRKECQHEEWEYFRRCKKCDRVEVLNPETGEYESKA